MGKVLRYVEVLRGELRRQAAQISAPATVYLGGGTPTILPREVLFELVRELAVLQRGEASRERPDSPGELEFTLEANPGTVDAELLEELASAGVTRISLGVQSFTPSLREVLGRRVTQEEITGALALMKRSGWRNWNLDLVFGIPGQSWREAAADLAAAINAEPTHISLYDLTYTPSYTTYVEALMGLSVQGAADFAERYYARAVAMLESAGYERYEVSNFARPGYECRHNLGYWHGEDFLGVGASAVSTVEGVRWTNPRTVAGYLAGEAPRVEKLSDDTRLWERAMLGLRTREGVDEAAVLSVIDVEACDRLMGQGLLERRCGKLRVNPGFLDVSNAIIAGLLVCPGSSRRMDEQGLVHHGTHGKTAHDS